MGNDKGLKFPDGFLWGAATSAHQIEGNNRNDWSEWEKKNAERLAREAKTKYAKWQQEEFPEMFNSANYISAQAADHYNRYEEDFDIAKSLGHNSHRFSMEWSRIEPEEGKFDEKEIEHYRQVVNALRIRGMEPFVTLWHWPLPLWLSKQGGWESKSIINYFERYAKKIAEEIPEVKFWITLNEPEVYASHSYLKGNWTPQKRNYFAYRRVIRNLVKAHKKAYSAIKLIRPDSKIGIAKHNLYFEAYKNRFINKFLKRIADMWWNEWFLKKISGYQDVIGVNNYHHNRINYEFYKNENPKAEQARYGAGKKMSDMAWELYPESLAFVVRELAKYKLPIYVAEHGLADALDSRREWFLTESLKHLHQAIKEGAPVRGYTHWSLLDNFEWDKGFWPRFGLIEVDYKTMERRVRPSARTYAKICRSNQLES